MFRPGDRSYHDDLPPCRKNGLGLKLVTQDDLEYVIRITLKMHLRTSIRLEVDKLLRIGG